MPAELGFDGVGKRYRLGASQTSLREALASTWHRILPVKQSVEDPSEYIWALRDVTFDVAPGSVLGIIGSNGAGKTTTLKLLAGVTTPTTGSVKRTGRISALIELGAGFHPDLTGRENVFLNGAILGLSRRDIERRFDDIVTFAEVERFIDTPVKRYSSGMYARLAFAVAAHADPEILIVDEVLAVGDAAFQRKCYDFMHSFASGGKTAVFVSHNLYVIDQLCTDVIWLDHGQVKMRGTSSETLTAYFDALDTRDIQKHTSEQVSHGPLALEPLQFFNAEHLEQDTFEPGEDIVLEIPYRVQHSSIERPHFCISVVGPDGSGPIFQASMLADGNTPESIEHTGIVRCRFLSPPLLPRVYQVWGEVWGADRRKLLVKWQRLGAFRIAASRNGQKIEVMKGGIRHLRAEAPIHVPYVWEYPD